MKRDQRGHSNKNLLTFSVTEDILTNFDNMSTQILLKVKDFIVQYETKIVLIIGFCLTSVISYEFGVLQGQKWQQKPLVIEKPSDIQTGEGSVNQGNSGVSDATKTSTVSKIGVVAPVSSNAAKCTYVGSKNSTKFYLPTCSYAKRIKPENVVCFKSSDEALGQGRTESKCN